MATVDQPTEGAPPPSAPPERSEYQEPVEREHEEPVEESVEEPREGTTLPPIVDPEGELEALEDRSMPIDRVLWAVAPDGKRVERTYVQQGLSWFGKLELYGLLGQAVKVVLEGDSPIGVTSLLDMARSPRQTISDLVGSSLPGADTAPDRQEEEEDVEAGKILAAFANVVAIAPDLLHQAYCIALAIPKSHRNWAIEWAFPNMDDQMGSDVLHTFVDQNLGVMEDFFARELPKIMRRVVKARSSAGPR